MNTPTAFRPIKGFPGYAIGETGEVISFKEGTSKFKSTHTNTDGYLTVGLCGLDGRVHTKAVHSLVAQAFLGPRPQDMVVDHIDGDKTNNNVTNLHYVTHRQNINNPITFSRNSFVRNSKPVVVSKDGVDTTFPSLKETCRQLDLSPSVVSNCLNGKCYSHSHKGYTFRYA